MINEQCLQMIAFLKDLVTVITLSIGAFVALRGLSAWKMQLKGNQDYHLAKSILINLHKYKESLLQVRNPAVWMHEYPVFSDDELKAMHHDRCEKSYRELTYAYQKRWDKIVQIKPVLHELLLESQVLWGDDLSNIVDALRKNENKLFLNLQNYLQNKNPSCQEKVQYDIDIIFRSSDQGNGKFDVELCDIINKADALLKSKLRL